MASKDTQGVPDVVANRMARRIAIGTGIPTLMGMGVFVGSYLLVSRQILDIAPSTTLAASGACFFLGLLGLSFGVLSASWEEQPGSLLGTEQIGLNISRLRSSMKSTPIGSTPKTTPIGSTPKTTSPKSSSPKSSSPKSSSKKR